MGSYSSFLLIDSSFSSTALEFGVPHSPGCGPLFSIQVLSPGNLIQSPAFKWSPYTDYLRFYTYRADQSMLPLRCLRGNSNLTYKIKFPLSSHRPTNPLHSYSALSLRRVNLPVQFLGLKYLESSSMLQPPDMWSVANPDGSALKLYLGSDCSPRSTQPPLSSSRIFSCLDYCTDLLPDLPALTFFADSQHSNQSVPLKL